MYKKRSTTQSWVMAFKITAPVGIEKIVHISHCSKLYTLADFIFHLYKLDIQKLEFEFCFSDEKAQSFQGFNRFVLGIVDEANGIGNMRFARTDSPFMIEKKLLLKIKEPEMVFVIEDLGLISPKARRRYPFVENYSDEAHHQIESEIASSRFALLMDQRNPINQQKMRDHEK